MTKQDFEERIRQKAAQNEANRKDVRFKKTIAFLKGKGLLHTNLPIAGGTSIRLNIEDVLWAGRNVEPRILEVLPAAILHFPKNFLNLDKLPDGFATIVKNIRANKDQGDDFEGVRYAQMKHWANMQLKDKRTKPAKFLKRTKTFRLHQTTIDKLQKIVAAGDYEDQTSAIEAAIENL